MNSDLYWYWFTTLYKLDLPRRKKILDLFGHPKELYETDVSKLRDCLTENNINYIENSKNMEHLLRAFDQFQMQNINFISRESAFFPATLRHIDLIPFGLFTMGHPELLLQDGVAIVGTRNCSQYGASTSYTLGKTLASEGMNIISGLARGIDTCAHKGAIAAWRDECNQNTTSSLPILKTIAVLGCGVDRCYPNENYSIYELIVKHGCIVSEHAPGTPPLRHNFPFRNRIISALSKAVVVSEAKKRSGSLITANIAIEQNKDIYVVPGRISDVLSEGSNELLLQANVTPLLNPSQILNSLSDRPVSQQYYPEKIIKRLEKQEILLYSCLDCEPLHIEEIASRCHMDVQDAAMIALKLELQGYIEQPICNYYIKQIEF